MTQLFNKVLKRAVSGLFAAVLLAGSVFAFAGCSSSTPKVTMTVTFNDKDYNISYKLYRKFFPATVQHFIELADAGYYDGLCFHDYQSGTGMFTGGYVYDETKSGDDNTRGLVSRDYFSWLEENDVTLTQSVFREVTAGKVPTEGTNTLVGEFEQNNYTIKNNDKKYGSKKDGALVMYYTPKTDAKTTYVTVKRNTKISEPQSSWEKGAEWYDSRNYAYNSATSLFYVSFTNESSVNKNYCVFGELYDDDAQTQYSALKSAISSYISTNVNADEGESFVEQTAALPVDSEDFYYKNYNLTATYEVPVSPIVIKKVKVNRY